MMGIKTRILQIIPISVYENKVYTQNVIVEIESGQRLVLFDSSKRCKDNFLGTVKTVDIIIQVARSIEVIDRHVLSITQEVDENASQGNSNTSIYCLIENIEVPAVKKTVWDFSYAIVNVGIGNMLFYLSDKEAYIYKKGDYLHIINGRLDLWKIYPE